MTTTPSRPPRAQRGPSLLVLAIVTTVLQLAGVLAYLLTPHAGPVTGFAANAATGLRLTAFCQLAAVVPLAILAATVYRRLRMLGVTAPGSAIAFAGGLLAAAGLTLCGLITWTQAQLAGSVSVDLARALGDLSFGAGSVGFVPWLALLVAGVAVPSLLLRFVPRAVAFAGLAIAAIGLLSVFTVLTPALDATLPIGRFGGLLWLLVVSAQLPKNRHRATTSAPRLAPAETA